MLNAVVPGVVTGPPAVPKVMGAVVRWPPAVGLIVRVNWSPGTALANVSVWGDVAFVKPTVAQMYPGVNRALSAAWMLAAVLAGVAL